MVVIDQEGGDKTFNEITLVLDRFERLREQKDAWSRAPLHAHGPHAAHGAHGTHGVHGTHGPASSSSAAVVSSPIMPHQASLPATIGFSSMHSNSGPHSIGGDEAAPPQPSPIPSHAASSEGAFESLPRRNNSSEVVRAERKKDKKEKKDKRRPSTDGFGFLPPGASGSAERTASGFVAWPPQEAEAGGTNGWAVSTSESTWPAPATANTAHSSGGTGFGVDGGGDGPPFGGWGTPTPGGDAGGTGFDSFPDAAGGWHAGDTAPSMPAMTSGSLPAAFVAFGEASGAHFGDTAVEAAGAPPEPTWHTEVPAATVNSQANGKPLGPSQTATLHIRCPFTDVDRDRLGFERLFVRELAQAMGVKEHRIRVREIRPGP